MSHTLHTRPQANVQGGGQLPDRIAQTLTKAVSELRYGVVQITVHDGKVVQLDVTERHRF